MYGAAVITVSDRRSRGEAVDTAGPRVADMLRGCGYDVVVTDIIPDDFEAIKRLLIRLCNDNISLVATVGGTGFSPRDVTPEATLAVAERRVPGIPEAMRAGSMNITERAMLSRAECVIRGNTLILNLPGSEKAAAENLGMVLGALSHGLDMLLGEGE